MSPLNSEDSMRKLFIAIFILLTASATFAQTNRLSSKEIAASLTSAIRPDQAAISPDGTQVAWVQPVGGPEGPHGIFVTALNGAAAPRRITAPQCNQCSED